MADLPVDRVLAGHLLLVLHVVQAPHHEGCWFSFLPAFNAIHSAYPWSLLLQVRQASSCEQVPGPSSCSLSQTVVDTYQHS